jgi:hypothetical protein
MASGFFKRFGLTLLVSLRRDKLEMMREREGEFVTFPYSLASDTLPTADFSSHRDGDQPGRCIDL